MLNWSWLLDSHDNLSSPSHEEAICDNNLAQAEKTGIY